jgi:hypothetical protein
MINQNQSRLMGSILAVGGSLTTIFLIDQSVTDPVNAPKLFILGVASFALLGALISRPKIFSSTLLVNNFLFPGVFFISSLIVLFTSDAPLSQSVYGSYGRNNGFLLYLFLTIVLICASLLSDSQSVVKAIYGLMFAGIVNVVYCSWALVFGDFIGWSNPYGSILGTLGNPNFIGAFLGIFWTACLAFLIGNIKRKKVVAICAVLLPVIFYLTIMSNAIQGRVLIAAGSGIVIFYWLKASFKNPVPMITFLAVSVILGGLSVFGALQKGPFVELIYKTSVSLRGQYWLAGWRTGLENPATGVGFDSFGDWYRRTRDIKALTLPGVNTVVNTAHNVPIDMFAFGGWPLFVSYVALTLFVLYKLMRLTILVKSYDFVLVTLAGGWLCYQLQSIISINQVGLAVWGWIFSGLIIAYEKIQSRDKLNEVRQSEGSQRRQKAPAGVVSPGLMAGVFALIGALISVPPLSADTKWRSALLSAQVAKLQESLTPSYMNPSNTNRFFSTAQLLEGNKFFNEAHQVVLAGLDFNPNSFDLWKLLFLIENSTEQERELAILNMKRLDPLNPDVTAK